MNGDILRLTTSMYTVYARELHMCLDPRLSRGRCFYAARVWTDDGQENEVRIMEGGQGSYLVIVRRRQLKGYLEIAMTDTLLLSSEDSSSSDEDEDTFAVICELHLLPIWRLDQSSIWKICYQYSVNNFSGHTSSYLGCHSVPNLLFCFQLMQVSKKWYSCSGQCIILAYCVPVWAGHYSDWHWSSDDTTQATRLSQ